MGWWTPSCTEDGKCKKNGMFAPALDSELLKKSMYLSSHFSTNRYIKTSAGCRIGSKPYLGLTNMLHFIIRLNALRRGLLFLSLHLLFLSLIDFCHLNNP